MAKKRGRESARDMIYSMGAVLVTVLIILGVTYRSHHQMTNSVDYQSALASARSQSSWPILTPTNIPKGFKVTQARFEPESYGQAGTTRWYLGFQTAQGEYVSLWQSDGPTQTIVAAASNGGNCSSTIALAGTKWTTCLQTKPLARTLYRLNGKQTIVVSGTVSQQELEDFAASLHVAN